MLQSNDTVDLDVDESLQTKLENMQRFLDDDIRKFSLQTSYDDITDGVSDAEDYDRVVRRLEKHAEMGSLINDLSEINRLLFVFDQYELESIEEGRLLRYMAKSPVITQAFLNHRVTIEFCEIAEIIQREGNHLNVSSNGRHLLNLVK